MRSRSLTVLLTVAGSAALIVTASQSQPAADVAGTAPGGQKETAGYSIGYDLGRSLAGSLRRDGVDAAQEAIVRGFSDALGGRAPTIGESEMWAALVGVQRTVGEARSHARMGTDTVFRAQAEFNAKEGSDFIAGFAKEKDAVSLPGGIVYRVIHGGTGEPAKGAKAVTVAFSATLPDGSLLGQGFERKMPVDTLCTGARQLVDLMKVGDRWVAAIPPASAYGLAGREPDIGPNQTVIVDVEIRGVER